MRAAPFPMASAVGIGMTAWLKAVLKVPFGWAVVLGVGMLAVFLAGELAAARDGTRDGTRSGTWLGTVREAWRNPGRRLTDHPVTIFESGGSGDAPDGRFMVALCDIDRCAWMEFAHPDDPESQERELRALAAFHTKAVVPGVEREQTR